MSSIPNAEDLYQILLKQLKEQQAINPDFHLAGLASGGAWIAERLVKDLQLPAHGVINVSFHRDDYSEKGVKALNSSEGMSTKLPFEVEGAHIIFDTPDEYKYQNVLALLGIEQSFLSTTVGHA